ncbi:MAG: ferredoxin [Patescibacteria group bacterium]
MSKDDSQNTKPVSVNSTCIGCGICASIAPEVFEMNSETGLSVVKDKEFSEEDLAKAREAQAACPVGAIEVSSE